MACKGNVLILDDVADFHHPSRFVLVIDALLGTGIKGDPHGLYSAIIEVINSSGCTVLAVDTPSGLNNDTGIPGNPCIRAAATVSMGFSKPGQYFYPGKELVGKLIVEDLNYPDEIVFGVQPVLLTPSIDDLRKYLPRRHPAGSKYDHGQSLLIGGSPGMTGSITLMAEAALRCGCGMVHCGFPEALSDILSVKLTEPVLHALPQTPSRTLDKTAVESILSSAVSMQALCIGPGLTHESSTTRLVRDVISRCPLPTVLDADGINAFKGFTEELKHHAGDLVITPHHGEYERLFGQLALRPLDRIAQLKKTADQFNLTILLKGNPTLVAAPDQPVVLLPFGNSALAKAGSGDVLSGIITSLIAQGTGVTDAAILGAYLHGCAGVAAAEMKSEYSVVARDIVEELPESIRTLV
jgi:NAD(P)H-hydrate epimerase